MLEELEEGRPAAENVKVAGDVNVGEEVLQLGKLRGQGVRRGGDGGYYGGEDVGNFLDRFYRLLDELLAAKPDGLHLRLPLRGREGRFVGEGGSVRGRTKVSKT